MPSVVGGVEEEAAGAQEAAAAEAAAAVAAAAVAAGEVKSAPVGENWASPWASPTLGVAKSAEKGVKGVPLPSGAGLLGMSRSHPVISSPAAHT